MLAGRHDLFTPPSVPEQMASTIPGAEIIWFEHAGHLLPVEEPDAVARALLRFLAERVVYEDGATAASD